MVCPRCGYVNTGEQKKCFSCGASLASVIYDVNKPVGFLRRGAAFLIDCVIIGVFAWLAQLITGEKYAVWFITVLIISIALPAVFELVADATPGKLLLGLRVAENRGLKPRPVSILLRNLLRTVFFFLPAFVAMKFPPLFIIAITEIFTIFGDKHQSIHDLMSKTMVVYKP